MGQQQMGLVSPALQSSSAIDVRSRAAARQPSSPMTEFNTLVPKQRRDGDVQPPNHQTRMAPNQSLAPAQLHWATHRPMRSPGDHRARQQPALTLPTPNAVSCSATTDAACPPPRTPPPQPEAMADAKPSKPKAPFAFDAAKVHGGDALTPPAERAPHPRRRALRWACFGLAVAGALAAAVALALSLTVLKVRDPTLAMESVAVRWFSVRLDARGLRVNVTLAAALAVRNPNYASLRFGASATEIFVDGVPGPVGVGRAPPGEVPARAASRVAADVDVLVDRVGPAVVGEVLFGGGVVRLNTRTAVDGRVSVLGGIYGRRTVRVAMRCRVALRVSAAVVVEGIPACVADLGR